MEKNSSLQEQLVQRDRYLQGIVQMQKVLLETPSDALGALNNALLPLGQASGADRVYVFENDRRNGEWLGTTSQKAEWCAEGVPPQIESPDLQNVDFGFLPVWLSTLKGGGTVIRLQRDFDEVEKQILGPQGILSLIVIPLMIDDIWTGFIGFDNCHEEAPWSEQELNLLRSAASQISLNFQQRRARRELMELNQTLEQKVLERTAQLADANRMIQGMLDSVSQGFFMFDESGICESVYSRACAELLEGSPAGRPVTDVLDQSGTAAEEFKLWYPLLFSPAIDFEDVAPLGPKLFQPKKSNRHILLDFFPLRNESSQIVRVVVIVTDRTNERNATLRAEEQKRYAEMIVKLVQHRKQFAGFVSEARTYLTLLREEFAKSSPDLSTVFRVIHTFKGAAASFSLGAVVQLAHQYETELSELRKALDESRSLDLLGWQQKIRALSDLFEKFLEENQAIVGSAAGAGGAPVEIPAKVLKNFVRELGETAPSCRSLVTQFERNYLSETFESLFAHYRDVVDLLAKRQNKDLNPLEIIGGHLRVMAEPYGPLLGSMVHAFRNAVDHGLETPEERSENGKPLAGTLSVSVIREVRDQQSWLKIQVVDDGRGIHPEKIRAKLRAKGYANADSESDEDVIQHVFDAGFSTREQVTDVSGRGIGMDAIRTCTLELGGNCRVSSEIGQGCTLTIEVPEINPVT